MKKPSHILKKGGKILLWMAGAFFFLLIFLFIFVQSDTFNKIVLNYTLDELNTSQTPRDNHINAESIEGNIFYGIKLNKGSVTVRNDTMLSFNSLEVGYDLWGLLDKRISLDHVILNEPVINITKISSGDSLIWNFENLFAPSEPDTTSSSFDWDLSVEYLKINNGFFRAAGDTNGLMPNWQEKRSLMENFDLFRSDISEFNLELSAKYYRDFKSVNINDLSFNTNSDLQIHNMHFNANINEKDTTTDLWNFGLTTNKSDIKIYRLYAESFNPFNDFDYEELGNKYIKASIDIQKFDFKELRFFLHELSFLDTVVGLKLDAEGKYGDLIAENIGLTLPNSNIQIKGRVVNLHRPDSLYLDVYGNNIVINTPDVKRVYKGNIPDFSNVGTVYADIKYKGTYTKFNSEFYINTDAGHTDGNVFLDLDNEVYSGYVNTRQLNIGRILRDNSFNSSLNLNAKFDGRGFDLNKMNSNLTYSMHDSRFGKYDVRTSGGNIRTNNGNITLNIKHSSSMGNVSAAGRINIRNMKNPVYNLKGNVNGLNVASVTGNASDKSNLNFNFDVSGSGISPENISGNYQLGISESFFGEYEIPSTPVNAQIHSSNSNGTISIKTDMADLNAEGSFKMDRLINVIMYNISIASDIIINSTGTADILNDSAREIGSEISINSTFINDNIDLSYYLLTKDSIKLAKMLEPFGVNFNGDISGNIKNSAKGFYLTNNFEVRSFSYNDTVFVLNNLRSNTGISNDYTGSLQGLRIDMQSKVNRLVIGNNNFDSVMANISMLGNEADIELRGKADTLGYAAISGKFNIGNSKISADLDTVKVIYGGYNIENKNNWVFSFNDGDKFIFDQFNIKSRSAVLSVSGELSLNNKSDLKLEGNNLKLFDIAGIVNMADSSYIVSADNDIEGELSVFVVTYKGTLIEPQLKAEIRSNTIKYQDSDIGVITVNANYENNTADALVKMENSDNKGTLTIRGIIPFQNPLSGDTMNALNVSTLPVDINLKADNFLLDNFSLLVKDIESLRGVLNADLTAKGTASDPQLTGNLKITEGGYLFPLTGMDYSFDADMSTNNFKLVLNRLKLYNVDDDSRHIALFGNLDFKDLKITDIDLEATGDMVLLDKDVEQNDLGVYGYILAGTGNPPVKVTGSLDSLFITGQLMIKDAAISSVPLEGSGYNTGDDNFVYIDAGNDSLKFTKDSLVTLEPGEYAKLNPFERAGYSLSQDSSKETFVNLDVNVKTESSIYASIDFNNITRDRLFGELKADLDIKTVNGSLQAFGSVDVAGDSYYRFYRNFKLNESNIKFDGDISNPVLDIKGVYSSTKNNEQYGSVTTSEVEVVITVKGSAKKPELTLNLYQDGSEVSGSDAQSDAITYLLFGRYKSELSASERTAVASSLGASVSSLYASSYLSQTVREVLPFIVDAQFNYTEGNVKDTDVELISELGDARVKFGGKLLKDVKNFELVVDYPLNRILNLNLPETLLLEFAREEKKQSLTSNQNDIMTTEIKILYKIKF
ncbi:MAG TPA: translocation/assembly module TamB domain-containing protein [Ignavibacteria bacterium]|nr:translocation/assembly module TamB domain-containing protein [Ignavibacteria bacterium]